jgi:predicted CopG family antitoxin
MKTKTSQKICISVPPDVYESLLKYAKRERRNTSNAISTLIDRALHGSTADPPGEPYHVEDWTAED